MYVLERDEEDATLDMGSIALFIGGLDTVSLENLGALIVSLDQQGIEQFEIETTR